MVGPIIPPNPVNDTDPCPWFIDTEPGFFNMDAGGFGI